MFGSFPTRCRPRQSQPHIDEWGKFERNISGKSDKCQNLHPVQLGAGGSNLLDAELTEFSLELSELLH